MQTCTRHCCSRFLNAMKQLACVVPCTTTLLSWACWGGWGGVCCLFLVCVVVGWFAFRRGTSRKRSPWGLSSVICPAAGQKQKTRLSALFSKPIKNLLLFFLTSSSSKQSNSTLHHSLFQTIFLYHTVLTNHPPTMPKSKRAQRGASSSILFSLFVLYLLRARNCARASTVKSRMLSGLHLPILHWKLFTRQSLKVPMRHKHLG